MENDPFGQGFLERIANCQSRIRDSRLGKIGKALQKAVPQFAEIRFVRDETTGTPHLEALYEHHRPNAGWQREDQFSDGTLRLSGLLWSLFEGDSLLLLEEPELSLNNAIVVAVRETEAWILADSEGFSAFSGVPQNRIPRYVESLPDPKSTLIGLVRRYGPLATLSGFFVSPGLNR